MLIDRIINLNKRLIELREKGKDRKFKPYRLERKLLRKQKQLINSLSIIK